jgi:hypothetical protein
LILENNAVNHQEFSLATIDDLIDLGKRRVGNRMPKETLPDWTPRNMDNPGTDRFTKSWKYKTTPIAPIDSRSSSGPQEKKLESS